MYPDWIRSSHLTCLIKKVLKFCKIHRKHLCQSLFFKKKIWHKVSSCEFWSPLGDCFYNWVQLASIQKQNSLYLVNLCAVLILVINGFTRRSSVTFVYYHMLPVKHTSLTAVWKTLFLCLHVLLKSYYRVFLNLLRVAAFVYSRVFTPKFWLSQKIYLYSSFESS